MFTHRSSRALRVAWRVGASGLIGLALVVGVASGVAARHNGTPGPQSVARVIPGKAIRGAVRSGEVNLATLPPATPAQIKAATASAASARPLLTSAQQAAVQAYTQWARTHPEALPRATGAPGLPSGSSGTNMYGNGALPTLTSAHAGFTSVSSGNNAAPDQAIAAAPGYIFEGVQNLMQVRDTTYAVKYGPWTPNQMFASVMHSTDTFSDPQITFDAERAIYLISWLESGQNTETAWNYIDIAISKTSSPSPLGNYLVYQMDVSTTLSIGSSPTCQYQALGYDYWNLHITCQIIDMFVGYVWEGSGDFSFSINKLLAGSVAGAFFGTAYAANGCATLCVYQLSPAIEDGVSQAEWLLASWLTPYGDVSNATKLTLCAITNTHGLDSGVLPTFSCDDNTLPLSYSDPIGVTQKGVTDQLWPGMGAHQFAYRNGQLYFTIETALSCSGATHDGVLWLAVTPQLTTLAAHNPQQVNGLATSATQANYWCVTGADVFEPTLMAGTEGDMALVFDISGANYYPSIGYTGRAAADAPGTMGQGGAWNMVIQGTNVESHGYSFEPWGLYSACSLQTNLVTRGLLRCGGEFGGPETGLSGGGWDTELYALRME